MKISIRGESICLAQFIKRRVLSAMYGPLRDPKPMDKVLPPRKKNESSIHPKSGAPGEPFHTLGLGLIMPHLLLMHYATCPVLGTTFVSAELEIL
jgi:hypothetical protein